MTKEKSNINNVVFFTTVIVAVIAIVFLLGGSASANMASSSGEANSLYGKISAVDSQHKVVTVQPRSGENIDVFFNDQTNILACDQDKWINESLFIGNQFQDSMKQGSEATITYHETGGVPVADSISVKC